MLSATGNEFFNHMHVKNVTYVGLVPWIVLLFFTFISFLSRLVHFFIPTPLDYNTNNSQTSTGQVF